MRTSLGPLYLVPTSPADERDGQPIGSVEIIDQPSPSPTRTTPNDPMRTLAPDLTEEPECDKGDNGDDEPDDCLLFLLKNLIFWVLPQRLKQM